MDETLQGIGHCEKCRRLRLCQAPYGDRSIVKRLRLPSLQLGYAPGPMVVPQPFKTLQHVRFPFVRAIGKQLLPLHQRQHGVRGAPRIALFDVVTPAFVAVARADDARQRATDGLFRPLEDQGGLPKPRVLRGLGYRCPDLTGHSLLIFVMGRVGGFR
jgi:hypothetical protein